MTKEKALELSIILKAYSEGKTIQRLVYAGWIDCKELTSEDLKQASMNVNGSCVEYRIKPEKKLVPFTFENRDIFKDKWFKHKSNNVLQRIAMIGCEGVLLHFPNTSVISYSKLFNEYLFEDGSPCGKYVEE